MARRDPNRPNVATGTGNTNPHPAGSIYSGGVRFGDPAWWVKHYGALPGVAFKPYKPPPLPTGTYDPALDAQLGAAQRGYGDTQFDTTLANTRGAEDLGFAQYANAEAVTNENDAYNRNVGLLTKNYTDLAANQADQANAAGVIPGGGAYLQSQAKRAANQATEQAGLDLTHQQNLLALQDQLGQVGVTYGRGVTDRTTALTRAGRENTNFGLDIGAEEAYQAGQAGYTAPGKGQPGGMPANERILPSGKHVQTIKAGGYVYTYGPGGKILSKKRIK